MEWIKLTDKKPPCNTWVLVAAYQGIWNESNKGFNCKQSMFTVVNFATYDNKKNHFCFAPNLVDSEYDILGVMHKMTLAEFPEKHISHWMPLPLLPDEQLD